MSSDKVSGDKVSGVWCLVSGVWCLVMQGFLLLLKTSAMVFGKNHLLDFHNNYCHEFDGDGDAGGFVLETVLCCVV